MKAASEMTTKVSADGFNKTQLNVDQDLERHVFHRDRLAHYYRWAHVTRAVKHGDRVVDLGCGTGALATMLYANRHDPAAYVGVDIRGRALDRVQEQFSKKGQYKFVAANLCAPGWSQGVLQALRKAESAGEYTQAKEDRPEHVCSFEFMEHVPGEFVEPWLIETRDQLMGKHTSFYLSTPCFDGKRKAENHVREWTYGELKELLEKHFKIEDRWGTFLSQKDLEVALERDTSLALRTELRSIWNRLNTYYGAEPMAIVFAPLFPQYARNCIWKLTVK